MEFKGFKKITKFKAQWWAIFAIFGIVLTFTACDEDDECPSPSPEEYPSLKVVNQNNDSRIITAVKLVGYEFENLSIPIGDSQIFTLDDGMPGGYEDLNITVSHKYSAWSGSESIKVNFNDGETTTITLKGCLTFEGCDGFYLEYSP